MQPHSDVEPALKFLKEQGIKVGSGAHVGTLHLLLQRAAGAGSYSADAGVCTCRKQDLAQKNWMLHRLRP